MITTVYRVIWGYYNSLGIYINRDRCFARKDSADKHARKIRDAYELIGIESLPVITEIKLEDV